MSAFNGGLSPPTHPAIDCTRLFCWGKEGLNPKLICHVTPLQKEDIWPASFWKGGLGAPSSLTISK
jgi:hypothetical protein